MHLISLDLIYKHLLLDSQYNSLLNVISHKCDNTFWNACRWHAWAGNFYFTNIPYPINLSLQQENKISGVFQHLALRGGPAILGGVRSAAVYATVLCLAVPCAAIPCAALPCAGSAPMFVYAFVYTLLSRCRICVLARVCHELQLC